MKTLKKISCCLMAVALSAAILYADMVFSFPDSLSMYRGQAHNSIVGAGISVKNVPKESFTNLKENIIVPQKDGNYQATLYIAGGIIPVKKISINVSEPKSILASGELIGLRLYNNGLIVLDTKKFICDDGQSVSPAEKAGVIPGDVIVKINGKTPLGCDDVKNLLKSPDAKITVKRAGREYTFDATVKKDITDNEYKLGVFVRDSTAGVGTMTYINANDMSFGALGHGINDSNTGVMFSVLKGTIEKSDVLSIKKGQCGDPGEICGSFSNDTTISGTVKKNCDSGIFGYLSNSSELSGNIYPVGLISQVRVGKAYILSEINDEVRPYEIEIIRTMPFGSAAKGMMIKITDKNLLEQTGGIIQGMSGSPIIQDEKIIGAVTHVLVNDPTCGYGIYIERMLSASHT